MTDRPRGMILAAGYGTRLAPVSDHLPKPLLPVPGGTLLDRAVDALDAAGVGEIAVNTHHLADRVAAHLAARPDHGRFTVCHEPRILGTGGALDGARAFLAAAPCFLLHNGDVLADLDLGALLAAHRDGGSLATLALVDWPPVNSVDVRADGSVAALAGRPPGRKGDRRLTYTGLAACDRALLDHVPPGFGSLVDALAAALAARPDAVRAFAPADAVWSDLGTLPRWLDVVADAGRLAAGDAALEPLAGHASDRRFWRLRAGGWSAVVMRSPAADADFARGLAVCRWLEAAGLGAPAVLDAHEQARVALLEDVGQDDLASLAPADRPDAYRRVVDHLLRLQAVAPCPEVAARELGAADLAWETGYFRERFLAGHLGLDEAVLAPLDDEFAALNAEVAAQPRVNLHRDFQSRNILLQDGRVRLVDVQDMRRGPLGYDLAALVWDPYVELGDALRADLVGRFAAAAAARHGLAPAQVAAMVDAAALQRLMQALGAYGFLGHVKGKHAFLAHVPRGVAHLRAALAAARPHTALPRLEALLATVDERT